MLWFEVQGGVKAGKKLGPLHGVPLAHKDMFDRKGKIASWGARIRADKPLHEADTRALEASAALLAECR